MQVFVRLAHLVWLVLLEVSKVYRVIVEAALLVQMANISHSQDVLLALIALLMLPASQSRPFFATKVS